MLSLNSDSEYSHKKNYLLLFVECPLLKQRGFITGKKKKKSIARILGDFTYFCYLESEFLFILRK